MGVTKPTVKETVTLRGLNQRGKNKVHERGPQFFRMDAVGVNKLEGFTLFTSLDGIWIGWLKVGVEVEITG